MKNKISSGTSVTFVIPESAPLDPVTGFAVNSGSGVLCGNLFGVASTHGFPGDLINLDLFGVFEMKKAPNVAISYGQKLYWDDKQKVLGTDPTLPWVAVASLEATALDAFVKARLNGVAVDPIPAPPVTPVRPSNG